MTDKRRLMIIIGGSAGHGKDSFAERLAKTMVKWCPVRTDAYAYTIKLICHRTFGTPWHLLNADKETKENTFIRIGKLETAVTIRRALQGIGQYFREMFGATVWANSVLVRARQAQERVHIITDARHPAEEIHWIGEQVEDDFRVFFVRVRRSSVPVNPDHPSESLILAEPDASFDFLVENEGDLDHLDGMAQQVANATVMLLKTGKKKIKKAGHGWGVFSPDAVQVCEPLLTSDEADTTADFWRDHDDVTHSVREMSYELLGGRAVV